MLDAAIEAGADDVISSESGHEIYASQETFREGRQGGWKRNSGEARKAALTWKATEYGFRWMTRPANGC